MKLPKIIICIIAVVFFYSCSNSSKNSLYKIPEVDIVDAFEKNKKTSLSKIVDGNVNYIELETNNSFIVGGFPRIYANEEILSVISFKKIFRFNRKNGNFISEIGHFGKDPDSYGATIFCNSYDESRNIYYARGHKNHLFYCFDENGSLINKINTPLQENGFYQYNDTTYLAYIKNYSGTEEKRLVFFNQNNPCFCWVKNYNHYANKDLNEGVLWRNHSWFYRHKTNVFFYELFTDTIYKVKECSLLPEYKLNLGKYLMPYNESDKFDFIKNESENHFYIENFFESDRYLFFHINFQNSYFQGVYDKKNKETYISGLSGGFENDIDNFIPFQFYSINNSGELVGFQEAYIVKKWFDENPDKAAKLPPNLQKLKNIKETDNPIVMIAKLKE